MLEHLLVYCVKEKKGDLDLFKAEGKKNRMGTFVNFLVVLYYWMTCWRSQQNARTYDTHVNAYPKK